MAVLVSKDLEDKIDLSNLKESKDKKQHFDFLNICVSREDEDYNGTLIRTRLFNNKLNVVEFILFHNDLTRFLSSEKEITKITLISNKKVIKSVDYKKPYTIQVEQAKLMENIYVISLSF